MLFHSLPYLVFFLVVYATVRATMSRVRLQNAFLLAASWVFYGWWDARFLSLLGLSIVVDFVLARALDRRSPGSQEPALGPRRRRLLVAASLAVNLGILALFKYFDFFVESAVALLTSLGAHVHRPTLELVLPVGISFYTFQTLSYTVDVYRGHMRSERSLLDFALYVSFFPQLVAGPIERASHLLPQIRQRRTITRADTDEGMWWVFWGLFKKVFVADNLARLVDLAFAEPTPGGGVVVVGVYAFAAQIYCDFSGYTDIARGCARLMGFHFRKNFDQPYLAVNPSDFWRRWHISLSTWLRDYLYVPLGGNRGGRLRTARNLMLTMLLGGLWHGAAWTFVAWGAFHGLALVVHRAVRRRHDPGGRPSGLAWARRLACFHMVCVGWLLFRATSLGQAADMARAVVTRPTWTGARPEVLLFYVAPLVLMEWAAWRTRDERPLARWPWVWRGLAYAVLWFLLTLLGEFRGGEFLYFQF